MKPEFKFVFPSKGLKDPILRFLTEAGFSLPGLQSGRKLSERDPRYPEIEFNVRQIRDIAAKVLDGTYDAGITGLDRLVEDGYLAVDAYLLRSGTKTDETVNVPGADLMYRNPNLNVVKTFSFARTRPQAAQFVIAGKFPEGDAIENLEDLPKPLRVGTEYPNLAEQFFQCRYDFYPEDPRIGSRVDLEACGIEFIRSNGATESMIASGEADVIADIVETGATLQDNQIQIVENLMDCEPALITSLDLIKSPKFQRVEEIRIAIQGAVDAWKENFVEVSMNVPEAALDTVFRLLPARKNPTLAPLTNPKRDPVAEKWFSVTTVMTRLELTRLAPQLLKARASAITQKALERVIS